MITLRNVTLRRGTKVVLDQARPTINPGENVGLVGRNGAGNPACSRCSTALPEDGGDFHIPPRMVAWRRSRRTCRDRPAATGLRDRGRQPRWRGANEAGRQPKPATTATPFATPIPPAGRRRP